ncbi:cell surface protein [Methanosarcina barkeri str. Wiesmoor]|uniref:Cell surface protein n=2 Tax=Methanosarcina barkeri TaxID=2208 RepID=A0A0E3QLQ7_METBA|nr:cell surface protein [Methanosarcina barkeri str. Wiesmoor]
MYVSSIANWDSKLSTNNFNVPNGTVAFARYYVGIWGSSYLEDATISTTFNGHEFETNPSCYISGMGVTWIPYNVTDYVQPGEKNTATINSKSWGDGRQYGTTLVVVLKKESKPQMEYWIADGLDWLHYGEYLGYSVDNSFTYFNGTVDLANVQSASLYSTHLTGYNYEDFNGKSLSNPADSTSGGYFDYIRWDNVKDSLVAENQTVNVGRGSDTYCSPVFHALSIEYKASDLIPVNLTPSVVIANTSNTMTATIENQGDKDSQPFNVSLMVKGKVVDTQSVSGLTAGGNTTVDLHWTPDGSADTYSLSVVADPENTVVESNENNNILTSLIGANSATAPVAEFSADKTSGDAPLTVTFTDQSTKSPISWSWDFDNDGTIDSTEQNPTYIYSTPGNYTVNLTVSNAGGTNSSLKMNYITVSAITPVANFTASPLTGGTPLTVNFSDQSTNTPTSWFWDFGDGTNATNQNPSHTYAAAGKYTINLTVSNVAGSDSEIKTDYISAFIPPVANFTATPTTGSAPLLVTFTDQSTNTPTSWLWDFGDGSNSTSQNPTHLYTAIGTYTVKLTATNVAGNNTTSKTGYITTSTTSGPVWASKSEWNAPDINTYAAPCLADLDDDGDYDLLDGVYSGYAYGYENTGTKNSPVWTSKSAWNTPDIGSSAALCLADLDNDGDYDLLIGDKIGKVHGYENTGTKNSPVWTTNSAWDVPDIGSSAVPCLVDLDNDGDYDLLIGEKSGKVYGYENTGTKNSPVWTANSAWDVPDIGSYAAPCSSDLDEDGDYDLLIGNTDGTSYAYENTGTKNSPVWTQKSAWNAPNIIEPIAHPYLADLDGDGDYDLLVGAYGGSIYGYENTAVSAVAKPDIIPTEIIPSSSITANTLCIISSTINNTGTENVDTFNATLSVNDTVVDTQSVSGIASGSSSTVNFSWTPKSADDYNLTVTADPENEIDESDETNNALKVLVTASSASATLVANFSADVTKGTVPLSVNFTDQSTGSPTSWFWDFGDGTNATEQNPVHIYSKVGNYTVNLTVENADGSNSEVKTEYIVVSEPLPGAPVANFTANRTSGKAPLDVQFTDVSTGNISSYAWDFDNDGNVDSTEQNPIHTYTAAWNYTVNLTVTNEAGSNSTVKTDYITVSSAKTNDLTISGIINTVPGSAVFAKEANTVKITDVKNTGTDTLTNISLSLYASDVSDGTVPVNTTTIVSLASGETVTVSLIDPTIRSLEGGTVTYTAVVDPDNLIPENNEANNNASVDKSVKYNGYKGKRYWEGGSDITTKETYDLQGNLLYSTQSSSAYKGVKWANRTETWTASDLLIPSGSTVEKAVLYMSYNWDTTSGGVPKWTATFNGNTLANGTLYTDKSNFGSYANYTYGLYVFDVTDQFNTAGNNLTMTPDSENSNALYPSTLVVVYRDSNETRKQIFINEECDELAYSPTSYGTTLEEATAYAPFTGMSVDVSKVRNATLYSFAGSAGPDEGNLLFNGNTVASNAWQGNASSSNAQVFDVKNYINKTGNEAGIQETIRGGMNVLQQILVVEYQEEQESAPVANFTANVTTGTAPMTVEFTDISTGSPTGWQWDFNDDGIIDSTEQNPIYTYSTVGNYTVNLTVVNADGNDSEVKTEYIVVSEPLPGAPVANFTATPTSGNAPLTVNFTDQSNGNISSYAWDFDNDGTVDSTEQNPIYTYAAAGTYTVNLTVANANGNDSEVKTEYIKVSSQSSAKPVAEFSANPTSGKTPLKVKFTDTSTGSPTFWFWKFGDGSKSFHQNPVHKYSKAGTYTVNLTVKNAKGKNTVTKTEYIKVITKPAANFNSSVTLGKTPLKVKFTDTSTGIPAKWRWDFGDGAKSFLKNPVHKYSKAGTYTVNLTVKNAKGKNTVTKTEYIKVITKPAANFSATPTSGKTPLKVKFTDTSTGIPAKWRWDFGDGAKSFHQNPVHKYSKAGTYTVNLTVKNAKGKNTVTKTQYIKVV